MEHETIFDADRRLVVKCKVCDIKCDTMMQFNIHQKSAKHFRKAERLKLLREEISPFSTSNSSQSSVSEGYQCQICQVTCNTKEQLNAHFTGQAHKKRSLKIEYKNWNDAEIPLSQFSTKTTKHCDDRFAVECQMSPLQSPVKECIKTPIPTSISSTKDNLPDVINDLLIPEYSPNFIKCKLCDLSMNTKEQFSMHCNGTKHKRKLATMNVSEMSLISKMSDLQIDDDEFEYCDICQIRIHCNNMLSHRNGKIHKEKMVKMAHTTDASYNHPNKDHLSPECQHFEDLKLVPRKYQIEVYEKSLNKDCVIFLPTGTGKTLVATMIILKMLEANPHHRVAFLVDKVLLVMQQHDFFKQQLRDVCLERFDTDGKTSTRQLRLIGLASSYVNTEHATSVRDHDIVIATAELFRGLVSKRVLFWEEFGLVILDEAHHCTKDHPYNRVMREYQLYPEHVLVNKSDINAQLLTGIPKVHDDKLNDWKKRRCKVCNIKGRD